MPCPRSDTRRIPAYFNSLAHTLSLVPLPPQKNGQLFLISPLKSHSILQFQYFLTKSRWSLCRVVKFGHTANLKTKKKKISLPCPRSDTRRIPAYINSLAHSRFVSGLSLVHSLRSPPPRRTPRPAPPPPLCASPAPPRRRCVARSAVPQPPRPGAVPPPPPCPGPAGALST